MGEWYTRFINDRKVGAVAVAVGSALIAGTSAGCASGGQAAEKLPVCQVVSSSYPNITKLDHGQLVQPVAYALGLSEAEVRQNSHVIGVHCDQAAYFVEGRATKLTVKGIGSLCVMLGTPHSEGSSPSPHVAYHDVLADCVFPTADVTHSS